MARTLKPSRKPNELLSGVLLVVLRGWGKRFATPQPSLHYTPRFADTIEDRLCALPSHTTTTIKEDSSQPTTRSGNCINRF